MKKVVSFLLIIIFVINIIPPVNVTAAAATKGTVNSVNWSYSKGVLTISLVKGTTDNGDWMIYENYWYGKYPWESYNSKITKIVFKSGVKRIPYGVFQNLEKLKEVQMANTIESIDTYAFRNCKKLKTLKLSKNLKDIGYNAFYGCVSLTSVVLPAGLKSIGGSAFAYCSGLKSIIIPDSVDSLEGGAFEGCASLKSAVLPKIMKVIPNSLFYNCGDLETVELPHNLETISYNAFRGCKALKSLTLPAGLTEISGGMFTDSDRLAGVVIPGGLNALGVFNQVTYLYFNTESAYDNLYDDQKKLSVILEEQIISINKGEKVKINAYYPSSQTVEVSESQSWVSDYNMENEFEEDYDWGNEEDYIWDDNYDWGEDNAWSIEEGYDWDEDWSWDYGWFEDDFEDEYEEPSYEEKYNLEYPDSTNVTINWVSLNPDIADVSSDGTVTAKKGGTVQIKAYVDDKNFAMCRIDVVSPTKSITAKSVPEYISVNEVYQLDVKVSPADSTQGIEYKVSGTKSYVSGSGELQAYKKGTFTLTVTSGAVTKKFKIVIENPKLNFESRNLTAGYSITAKLKSTKRDVNWKSTNPSVLKVDSKGKLTGLKQGYSCVIAQVGSMKYYCDVNVISPTEKKILALQDKYPDGYYWNNYAPSKKYPAVTETPCSDHLTQGYSMCKGQCAGFASLMSNEVYGTSAPRYLITDINSVRTGDYIRYGHHSIFIINAVKKGDIIGYNKNTDLHVYADSSYWTVVHCNWDYKCNIRWFDKLTINEITSSESYRRTL